MATITLKGNPITTCGELPAIGTTLPDFKLVNNNLSEMNLSDVRGKQLVISIFPSLDTSVCAMALRRFNAEASKLENCAVLCVSKDLPFAHKRFCAAEGMENVITLSDFRSGAFGRDYGVEICDGPMAGLLSRAVIVTDNAGTIIYTEQVPEIGQEPNYEAALKALHQ